MPSHFRRSITVRPHPRRGAHTAPAAEEAPAGPSLTALVATMLLFDRDPGLMIAQVRAWLAEREDRA
jgi:hypothetical protein